MYFNSQPWRKLISFLGYKFSTSSSKTMIQSFIQILCCTNSTDVATWDQLATNLEDRLINCVALKPWAFLFSEVLCCWIQIYSSSSSFTKILFSEWMRFYFQWILFEIYSLYVNFERKYLDGRCTERDLEIRVFTAILT